MIDGTKIIWPSTCGARQVPVGGGRPDEQQQRERQGEGEQRVLGAAPEGALLHERLAGGEGDDTAHRAPPATALIGASGDEVEVGVLQGGGDDGQVVEIAQVVLGGPGEQLAQGDARRTRCRRSGRPPARR